MPSVDLVSPSRMRRGDNLHRHRRRTARLVPAAHHGCLFGTRVTVDSAVSDGVLTLGVCGLGTVSVIA
ncbi:MAG: hypothetical protein ACRDSZ_05775 [Pseudonocardiaceae bacterium]